MTFGLFKPVFWFINTDCAKEPTDLYKHMVAASKNRIMAYRLATDIPFDIRIFNRDLQHYFMSNMESVTEDEMENGPLEAFIDFRKKPEGELIVKLKKLNFDNRKVKVENNDLKHPNILRIFCDTVSR